MESCKKCGEAMWGAQTKCNCREFTVTDDSGEDYRIFGWDHQHAATAYAEKVANADYDLMDAGDVKVDVTDEHGAEESFWIGAEPDINYWAKPAKSDRE